MSEKEYAESRLPKYPGLKFRRFTVEEYYAIFELDCLPEGTSQELWDGIAGAMNPQNKTFEETQADAAADDV